MAYGIPRLSKAGYSARAAKALNSGLRRPNQLLHASAACCLCRVDAYASCLQFPWVVMHVCCQMSFPGVTITQSLKSTRLCSACAPGGGPCECVLFSGTILSGVALLIAHACARMAGEGRTMAGVHAMTMRTCCVAPIGRTFIDACGERELRGS